MQHLTVSVGCYHVLSRTQRCRTHHDLDRLTEKAQPAQDCPPAEPALPPSTARFGATVQLMGTTSPMRLNSSCWSAAATESGCLAMSWQDNPQATLRWGEPAQPAHRHGQHPHAAAGDRGSPDVPWSSADVRSISAIRTAPGSAAVTRTSTA